MLQTLADALIGVEIRPPLAWRTLRVFPLHSPNGHTPAYTVIDALLAQGEAEIRELDDGGAVPVVRLLNRSPHDALVVDGTELRGAKQNRMVTVTIVAGREAETEIPVACVEAGRWAYRTRAFSSARRTVASGLRNRKAHDVKESLRASGRPAAHQGRVWSDVDAYLSASAAASPTRALDDAFTSRAGEVDEAERRLGELEVHGVLVANGGRFVALDLFDAVSTFTAQWPALLRGHALEAAIHAPSGAAPHETAARAWLAAAASAVVHERRVPGVARYFAIESPELAGGVVHYGGQAIHTAVFPS